MWFRWLKRYMPRGLYGRAALILILPVVTLQLVVSVVFIQRHFEGVTEQMTRTIAAELNLISGQLSRAVPRDAPDAEALWLALGHRVTDLDALPGDLTNVRRWYDFTGLVVIRTLNDTVPGILQVRLPTDRAAIAILQTRQGPVEVAFDRRRVSASNPHQLLVNMIVFGALMTLIAFIYLRNQLRPITRLARAAAAFGRGRTEPYVPGGAIEVREAGHAFLDMRARIERQIEQRTMMLSGVSHDLRTPLTRLKLGLSLLEDDEAAPMLRDVADMQRLLDEFLSFARGDAEAGEPEAIEPFEFAASIAADAARSGKTVELGAGTGQGGGTVILRPVALRRALENLLNNACRYGARARLTVALTDKSLRFRVEDDGPGIPPDKRDLAVRPFVRLDPARNQDKGPGVGLGLAIAADIARSHGGTLRLKESIDLGGLCADIVIGR